MNFQRTASADDAAAIRDGIWRELGLACRDRGHDWRTPVLASAGLDGAPQARTVVLREVVPGEARLVVYSDRRSPKVAELLSEPRAALVFWSRRLGWQLRAGVLASVEVDGENVRTAWSRIAGTGAAGDYLAPAAPGAPLVQATRAPATAHQLCVVAMRIEQMDWLALAADGNHRRIRFSGERAEWLVP